MTYRTDIATAVNATTAIADAERASGNATAAAVLDAAERYIGRAAEYADAAAECIATATDAIAANAKYTATDATAGLAVDTVRMAVRDASAYARSAYAATTDADRTDYYNAAWRIAANATATAYVYAADARYTDAATDADAMWNAMRTATANYSGSYRNAIAAERTAR